MIEKVHNKYYILCDRCQRSVKDFDTYEEVYEYMVSQGWKMRKANATWEHHCPICVADDNGCLGRIDIIEEEIYNGN